MKKLLPLFLALILLFSLSLPVPALADRAGVAEAAEKAKVGMAEVNIDEEVKARMDEADKAAKANTLLTNNKVSIPGFILSRGDLWIVGAGLVLAVAAVIVLVIHKKKKV